VSRKTCSTYNIALKLSYGLKCILRAFEESNDIHMTKTKTIPVRVKKLRKNCNDCVKNVSALELWVRGVKIRREVTVIKSYKSAISDCILCQCIFLVTETKGRQI